MKFLKIFFFLIFLSSQSLAAEAPKEVQKNFPNYFLIGENDLKVLVFDVYNIALWSESPQFSYDQKFAISIKYKRNFSSEELAQKSIEEIGRINAIKDEKQLKSYYDELLKIFTPIKIGDTKTAIFSKKDGVLLFHNSVLRGKISDPKLARYFVDIWLSEKSSYPKMTAAILGKK
jgi:hypothetical protein